MKLRIKGNSLRLRVSRSEMDRLLHDGHIEESIRFAPDAAANLTYALEHAPAAPAISLHYLDRKIRIMLSTDAAEQWAGSDEVGVYGEADTGGEPLALIVEKDYACLDRDDPQDADAFPNPKTGMAC
jgi:hypothetical protein